MADKVEIIITAKDDVSKTVGGIKGALGGLGGAVKSVGTIATGAFIGIGAAAVGGFGVVMKSAFDMNATLETSTLQFETLMGDADKAAEHVAGLFEFAEKTPFETGPIIDASLKLQTFGGEALNTMENLTLIGDAAAATNAPIDELGFWVGRLFANLQAGQPFGEAAMRLQELAVMSPEARLQMEALQESGASAEEIFAVFQGSLGEFTGAMEKQAGTWQGLTSTIKDQFQIMSAQALKPFFDLAKEGLAGLSEWLNSPDVQAGIQRIAEGFATLVEKVAEFVTGTVVPFVQEHGEMLKNVLMAIGAIILATVIPAIVSMVISMAPLLLVIAAVTAVIALLRAAWESNFLGIRDITQAVIDFIKPFIENALASIRAWWDAHGAAIMAAAQQAWNFIQNVITTVINIIRSIVTTVLSAIQAFWQAWGDTLLASAKAIWEAIKGLIEGVINQVKGIIDLFRLAVAGEWEAFGRKLFDLWKNAWDTILNFIRGIWNAILPIFQNLWQSIQSWWNGIDWGALGRNLVNKIVSGIQAAGGAILSVLMGIAKSAWEAVIGFFKGSAGSAAQSATSGGGGSSAQMIGGGKSGFAFGGMGFNGMAASGNTTIVNIDARGAARGVDRDIRQMVIDVLREQGLRADVRMRTGY